MTKVERITIEYENHERIEIQGYELEKMKKAAEAIELMNEAKQIATRLARLSE